MVFARKTAREVSALKNTQAIDAHINGLQREINEIVSLYENEDGSPKEHDLNHEAMLLLRARIAELTARRAGAIWAAQGLKRGGPKGLTASIRGVYEELMAASQC